MPRRAAAGLIAAVCAAALAAPASAAVHLTELGTFDTPVHVASPPADPERLFVVEKEGRIVQLRGGQKFPFLDIEPLVVSVGEQGLLSMAFAPDYPTSRKFYVYYTAPGTGGGSVLTIAEYATADADTVDPASRRVVLEIPHPDASNHNGGQLQFGYDGALYAATGDGAVDSDKAQATDSQLGKLLRIEPLSGAPVLTWASGLRNPWRFSFDRQTGDMIIADVGEGAAEEVNFTPLGSGSGVNYGWPCWEGTVHQRPACNPPGYDPPVLEKRRSTGFCAIVGGYVVRDPALPELFGRYVYGDFCLDEIRSAALVEPPATVSDDTDTGLRVSSLYSFGEDYCGHIYLVSGAGPVYRLDGDGAFTPCPGLEPDPEPEPEPPAPDTRPPTLTFTAAARQRVLRRGGVRVRATCDESCSISLRARARIGSSKKRRKLYAESGQLAPGERARFKLALTEPARRKVARALRRGRRVRIRVTAAALDSTGNRAVAARTVEVRR
jgi:hypothetical protein